MKGKGCIILITERRRKSLMKCLDCAPQLHAMPQTPWGVPVHSLLPFDNTLEILQPYRKEKSGTRPMKVLHAMRERNESHLSGVWRNKHLGSHEGYHQK